MTISTPTNVIEDYTTRCPYCAAVNPPIRRTPAFGNAEGDITVIFSCHKCKRILGMQFISKEQAEQLAEKKG